MKREDILTANDLRREKVDVPEWGPGEFVHVRSITAADRDAYQLSLGANGEASDMSNFRAKFLTFCLCDETGQRLFDIADADALGAKSNAVIHRLFEIAQTINAMDAEAVEAARKNS